MAFSSFRLRFHFDFHFLTLLAIMAGLAWLALGVSYLCGSPCPALIVAAPIFGKALAAWQGYVKACSVATPARVTPGSRARLPAKRGLLTTQPHGANRKGAASPFRCDPHLERRPDAPPACGRARAHPTPHPAPRSKPEPRELVSEGRRRGVRLRRPGAAPHEPGPSLI